MTKAVRLSGVVVAAACLLALLVPVCEASAVAVPEDALYVPGEVVVVFRARGRLTSPLMDARNLARTVGGRVARLSGSGAAVIRAAPGADVKALARRFAADANVRFAEPNYIYRATGVAAGASAIAAPPGYVVRKARGAAGKVIVSKATLRAMKTRTRTGIKATYPTDKLLWDNGGWDWVNASIVWNNTTPSKNVCVIDTGVDYLHKDLAARIIKGWDCVNEDADPMDDNGHGTHMAGIIAARQNNAEGIAGVSPTAKVVAVKALGADGWGTNFDVAQAISYCASRTDVSIINLSLGGPYSKLQEDAVGKATENTPTKKGKLLVVSAGNDDSDVPYCNDGSEDPALLTTATDPLKSGVRSYPAGFATASARYDWDDGEGTCIASATPLHDGFPAVLSVGAGGSGAEFDYSCRADFSNFGEWVNITAPGADILSTTPWGRPFTMNVEDGIAARYDYLSGTSIAAAFVSGTAARAWGYQPAMDNGEIAEYLLETGAPLEAEAGDPAAVCWPESMTDATDVNVAAALERGGLVADAIDAVTGLPLIGATIQALQGTPLAVKASAVLTATTTTFPYDPEVYLSYPSAVDLINLPVSVTTTLKVNKSGYTAAATNAFVGGDGNPDGTIAPVGGWLYAGYAAVPPKSVRFTAVSAWDLWYERPAPTLTTSLPDIMDKTSPLPLFDGQPSNFVLGRNVCDATGLEGETDGELSVFPNARVVYQNWADTHQIMQRAAVPAQPQWTGDYVFRVYNPDLDFDTRQGSLFIWKDGIMKARVNMTDPGCDSTTDWWEAAKLTSGKTGIAAITALDTCAMEADLDFPVNCP